MKIGLVCPYSFDVPGGVQNHVRDLARELRGRGLEVEIFAPSTTDTGIEGFVSAGRTVPVPFNGSVARLCFGPAARVKTRAWLAESGCDLLHIHEPLTPSVSLIALSGAECPVVATFHTATEKSITYLMCMPFLATSNDKISARIAVSAEARRTLVNHQGGDAVIIPNGVDVGAFDVEANPEWAEREDSPVFVFLGRLDEERKGLPVLAAAIPIVLDHCPGARFLIAGRGDAGEIDKLSCFGTSVQLLGAVSDEEKARLLAGATAYVAPQTGGESFGIVLVEAMAAGTLVVASNIPAFADVLDQGRAGRLFPAGEPEALAAVLLDTVLDRPARDALAEAGRVRAQRYDWSVVTDDIVTVYDTVLAASGGTVEADSHGEAGNE